MMDQVNRFRTAREILDSTLKNIELTINTLQFQQADKQIQSANELHTSLEELANSDSNVQQRSLQNFAARIQALETKIQDGLARREAGKKEDGNIAFKCNWNDAGYKGICSNEVYQNNRKSLRSQCARSDCREYIGKPPPIDQCCYECQALRILKFGAGWDHDEAGNAVRPRHIWNTKKGRIAILTTIPPWTSSRLVVGAFQIKEVKDDSERETYIFGDEVSALDDMLGYSIDFWSYYKNPWKPESKAWGQGLFRYISNVTVLGILEEYKKHKISDSSDTSRVDALIGVLLR